MTTIHVSEARLLREICEQLQIEVSQCFVSPDPEGKFLAYIDIQVPRPGSIIDVVRCWSSPCSSVSEAEQAASRCAVKKLVEELNLQVRDANFDDCLFYKNLYSHMTTKYAVLFAQYSRLSQEYNFLKDSYVSAVARRDEFAAERLKIRRAIDDCHALLNNLDTATPAAESVASTSISPSLG